MSNLHTINLSQYKKPEIIEKPSNQWVEWGEDNSYFGYLIDTFKNSTTHNAVINNINRLIYGRGLTSKEITVKSNEWVSVLSLISSDEIRKIVTDLKMFGMYSIQVHYDKGRKKIKKAFHIPVNLVCPEKCNEEGEIKGYYYSDNWAEKKKFPPKRLDAFGFGSSEIEVLRVMPYMTGHKYYCEPDYIGGVPYAVLENEIAQYLINDVQNGFAPSTVVNVVGNATPEQKDQFERKIKDNLTGAKGKKVIVSFITDKEQATTVEKIALDNAPEHYQYLSDECQRKIMLSHNVTSPLIFGISSTNGFSSNADELKNSLVIYDNLVIRPFQDIIIKGLNEVLKYNGISIKLEFKSINPFEDKSKEIIQPQQLSEQKSELLTILEKCEKDNQKGWLILDERDVDVDDEEILDRHIFELNEEIQTKLTKLSFKDRIVKLFSSNPEWKSEQDKKVKETYFKVRYRYTGNKSPERDFCKTMMSENRLFRKEDIDLMSTKKVNRGFGENGSDIYDIFRFKGGARCNHKWQRVTMMLDLNNMGEGYKEIGTRIAEIRGFKVTNPYEVSIYPKNLPLKGFSPNNKNLPSDVR